MEGKTNAEKQVLDLFERGRDVGGFVEGVVNTHSSSVPFTMVTMIYHINFLKSKERPFNKSSVVENMSLKILYTFLCVIFNFKKF